MRLIGLRSRLLFAAIVVASAAAACTSSSNGTVPPPVNCITCVRLTAALQTVELDDVNGISIDTMVAGSGVVFINDSATPFSPDLGGSKFYTRITAYNGSATLTFVPGFSLQFVGRVPVGTFRRATLEQGEWTTVGTSGVVKGHVVTLAASRVSPPIHLNSGDTYEVGVYTGGVLPPSPSPSPSTSPTSKPTPTPTSKPTPTPTSKPTPTPTPTPTPKPPLSVTVTCNVAADACTNGTMTTAGSVQFTAVGNTATLTPSETPASTFTLKSDTCNTTDDPSAGGDWATLSPGPGNSASSFTVTAKSGGTKTNPSSCTAVLSDSSGQTVTIDIGVTLSGIGIH